MHYFYYYKVVRNHRNLTRTEVGNKSKRVVVHAKLILLVFLGKITGKYINFK